MIMLYAVDVAVKSNLSSCDLPTAGLARGVALTDWVALGLGFRVVEALNVGEEVNFVVPVEQLELLKTKAKIIIIAQAIFFIVVSI
jgi:hypothetical protein